MKKKIIEFKANHNAKDYTGAYTEICKKGLQTTYFAMLGYLSYITAEGGIIAGDNMAEAIKEPPENIEAINDILTRHGLYITTQDGDKIICPYIVKGGTL